MIGIITTMDEEVISIKRRMHVTKQKEIAGMIFFVGTIDEKEVVVVRSGVGKVAAAICTQILIDLFQVSHMINTGVAAGLHPDVAIGDLVIASDALQNERNLELITMVGDATKKLKGDHKVFVGHVGSEDQFICSIKVKEEAETLFRTYCAEMEGAAIAHTCFLNQIPFVMIRTISDTVDPSSDVNFEDFVDMEARNTSRIIEEIVCSL